jgi:superfamily I DNA/RNA helicase
MALVRAHTTPRQRVRTGLTIHQAKNREFDRVVVLWPVQVPGDNEVQRRLLYNAITRAKYDCVVIVQNPNPRQSRTTRAPFA